MFIENAIHVTISRNYLTRTTEFNETVFRRFRSDRTVRTAVKYCGDRGLAMGAAPKAFRSKAEEWSGSGTADVAPRTLVRGTSTITGCLCIKDMTLL